MLHPTLALFVSTESTSTPVRFRRRDTRPKLSKRSASIPLQSRDTACGPTSEAVIRLPLNYFLHGILMLRSAYRATAFAIFIATAILLTSAFHPAPVNSFGDDMDSSIDPGDDFYRYANGGWLKTATIPARQASFDNRAILTERANQQVRSLVQAA